MWLATYHILFIASSQIYCKFLKSWKVSSSTMAKTFLDYTNEWINLQNRGGLYHVSDGVYLLIRSMEFVSRTILTKDKLHGFPHTDLNTTLSEKILSDHKVQNYWCSVTQGKVTGELSKKLLHIVVKKWIKIRTKAFINVYLNLKKYSDQSVSKKAEKALRKDL